MSAIELNNLYYSNFDKYHQKYFLRAQCTEPTPLALDNFQRFSTNSKKYSVLLDNAMHYSFLANGPLNARWSENAKYCFYHNQLQTGSKRILKF